MKTSVRLLTITFLGIACSYSAAHAETRRPPGYQLCSINEGGEREADARKFGITIRFEGASDDGWAHDVTGTSPCNNVFSAAFSDQQDRLFERLTTTEIGCGRAEYGRMEDRFYQALRDAVSLTITGRRLEILTTKNARWRFALECSAK